jgi:two-component system, OmpR family, sensor kinase
MTDAPDRAEPRFGSSVRSRILAVMLTVAGLALAIAGGVAYTTQRTGILGEIDSRLEQRVEGARIVVTGEVSAEAEASAVPAVPDAETPADVRGALASILQRIVPAEHESALGVLDGSPVLLPPTQMDFHLESTPGLVDRIVAEVADGSVRMGTTTGEPGAIRYIAAPVQVAGDEAAGVYIAAIDIDGELDELDAAFGTYTWVALAALAAVGAIGWFVAGRLLRPIRRLRLAASRITVSDLSERIPVHGTDDVSQLTATVNGMLDRLDTAIGSQRRLLDDVRHELKTPITIVRGHLELLDPADADEVAATRDLAIGELDRMSGLVDQIELLAEEPEQPERLEPVDVAALTAEVHAKARVVDGHEWILAEQARATVVLDPRRITQAWLQLVDNAAKYSPPGSPVRIGSTRRDGAVECWVQDEGAGIPEGMEQRIFERFGRVDTGRGVRGSGLGLPIVLAIAEAHGGRVSLSSSTAGSRFAIVLPIERPTGEEESA